MENQHRQIIGYRDLTADEIALMNEIKAAGHELGALLDKVNQRVREQASTLDPEVLKRHSVTEPFRWLALAKTSLQQGVMYATRAVAQPDDGF